MKHVQMNEQDLDKIFAKTNKNTQPILKTINYLVLFLSLFFVAYLVINISAISNIVSFWYSSDVKLNTPSDSSPYKNAVISIRSNNNSSLTEDKIPNISENHIFIPSINTDAPITWRVNDNENEVQTALQNGVIHINGTALPGEVGNTFITGHSSNYFWAKGNYKNIFSLLNRLVVGDLVYVKYQGKVFVYKNTSTKIVKPNDLSVIQATNSPVLTLMTCSPVGTSINRLIIRADQILPSTSTAISTEGDIQNLPQGVR